MTKSTALNSFIDDKYIPLEKKYKLGGFIVLLLIPVAAFFFSVYQPNTKKIEQLNRQKKSLNQEVKKIETRAANREKFLRDFQETEVQFATSSALLPKEKEIPRLLTNISALGRGAGLDFLSFKPKPTVPKDFYTEIPISIAVKGSYHSVGLFFDEIRKLSRIVSVASIDMTNPKKDGAEMLLNSNCKLMTYRFTNKPIEKPKKGKK